MCRTSQGRFCKFLIEGWTRPPGNSLIIRWVTYEKDGSVHSKGSKLTLRLSFHCDLDEGLETKADSDFWWVEEAFLQLYLRPENGAVFYKAW